LCANEQGKELKGVALHFSSTKQELGYQKLVIKPVLLFVSHVMNRTPHSFHQTNMGANSFEEHEKRRKSSRQLGPAKKKKKFVEFMSMRLKYFVPKSVRSPKDAGIVTPVPVGRRIHN
jgi:hypothetical protein